MASNGNILVIDDNAARAEALAELVSSAGYKVRVISQLDNSDYSLAQSSELDVILCELDLKGVSWVDARRTLSEIEVQVPSIMFSDRAEVESMMTA